MLNYGVDFEKKKFVVSEDMCVLPDNLSLFYAVAVSLSTNPQEIAFAGLDGYSKNDTKFYEVQKKMVYLKKFKKKFKFITPTLYRI